jgi:hypothetical protein
MSNLEFKNCQTKVVILDLNCDFRMIKKYYDHKTKLLDIFGEKKYDISKMKLHYIDLHVQQLQVRFLLLLLRGVLFSFFFNLSYGPSL